VKKRPLSPDEPSFEEALRELETIVRKLEGGELSLDESLALFERGQALAARCGALLDAANLKVKQLTPQGELSEFEGDA
jgi:exodeoxyribonuclease VII small subunit